MTESVPRREPGEPGRIHAPDAYLRLWAGLWEDAIELAVAGDRARYGVSREESLQRLARTFQDEVARDTPAMLRVARALRHG
jgi:hypothetical protein